MIELDRKTFTDQFALAASCCPSRTTKDVLKNVLFCCNGESSPYLLASDGECHIRVDVGCKAEPFAVLLPASRTMNILRELTEEKLEIFPGKTKVEIVSGGSQFNLQFEDPNDFPPVPFETSDLCFKIDAGSLRNMLAKTLFCTDASSTRFALGGVKFEVTKNEMRLVATDARRLSTTWAQSGIAGDVGAFNEVVPSRALSLLSKTLGEGEVRISHGKNDVTFRVGSIAISSQLVQGRFPDWRKVVPKEFNASVQVSPKSLLSIVRQASITTSEESRGTDFQFSNGEIIATSQASDVGSSKSKIPVSYDGPNMLVTLDGRYLGDGLKAAGDEAMDVCLIDKDSPVMLTCAEWKYVVMPLARD